MELVWNSITQQATVARERSNATSRIRPGNNATRSNNRNASHSRNNQRETGGSK
jgi:hypothetical protein